MAFTTNLFLGFSFSDNRICDGGAISVGDALKVNTTLTELHMAGKHKKKQKMSMNYPTIVPEKTNRRQY